LLLFISRETYPSNRFHCRSASFLGNGFASRGLFMGLWNAHTSIGNIFGSLIAGIFVDYSWGWSFVVPGLMLSACGILTFFFLLPYPEEVGVSPPERIVAKVSFLTCPAICLPFTPTPSYAHVHPILHTIVSSFI
ncbi:Sugar phosphate exchanger 2, partial [Fasciolopsis buskii]